MESAGKMSIADDRPVRRRHWHHDVHESWGRRRLHFWLFQFSQLYPREPVLEELRRIAEDNDVTSYASYEVLGEWDLLARLYMDPFRRPKFWADAKERLERYGLRDQRSLEVEQVVRHWVWADGRRRVGTPRIPERRDLEKLWPRSELRILNSLDGGHQRTTALARKYANANLLTLATHGAGMKLAVALQRRGPLSEEPMYERMKADLADALDSAGSWLKERSLYACGRESDTPFLIMCRFAYDAYPRVRFELLEPIGKYVKPMNARVTTFPIISDDLVCFTDRLPPSVVQPAPSDVKTLLEGPETVEFEIKGSALAPLEDWLKKGKLPIENDGFFVDTIAKETVAFLNSGGGSLVIGAVETKRYQDVPALEEYERNNCNIICGILDPTFRERGWDVWERKLRDLLRKHIDPSPGSEVELRQVLYGDAVLCLIAVDAVEPDYYLQSSRGPRTFWAREGTSARRLDGRDMERHKKRVRARLRLQRRRDTA